MQNIERSFRIGKCVISFSRNSPTQDNPA